MISRVTTCQSLSHKGGGAAITWSAIKFEKLWLISNSEVSWKQNVNKNTLGDTDRDKREREDVIVQNNIRLQTEQHSAEWHAGGGGRLAQAGFEMDSSVLTHLDQATVQQSTQEEM